MAPSGDAKLLFCIFFIACSCLTGELTQGHRYFGSSLFSSDNGLFQHHAKQDVCLVKAAKKENVLHISVTAASSLSLVDSEGKVWKFSSCRWTLRLLLSAEVKS